MTFQLSLFRRSMVAEAVVFLGHLSDPLVADGVHLVVSGDDVKRGSSAPGEPRLASLSRVAEKHGRVR